MDKIKDKIRDSSMKDRDHDYDKDKTLGLAQGLRLVPTSCHYSCVFMLNFIIVVISLPSALKEGRSYKNSS